MTRTKELVIQIIKAQSAFVDVDITAKAAIITSKYEVFRAFFSECALTAEVFYCIFFNGVYKYELCTGIYYCVSSKVQAISSLRVVCNTFFDVEYAGKCAIVAGYAQGSAACLRNSSVAVVFAADISADGCFNICIDVKFGTVAYCNG